MLPRPRTLCLLVGAFFIGLGLWGLFSAAVTELRYSPVRDAFSGETSRLVAGQTGLEEIISGVGRLVWLAVDNVFFPMGIAVLVIATFQFWRNQHRKDSAMTRWSGFVLVVIWAFVCLFLGIFSFMQLSILSGSYWWVFIIAGFMWCVMVILFNSEELTDRWLKVCMNFAVFVCLFTFLLIGVYCYGTTRSTEAKALAARSQSEQDRSLWREVVSQYARGNAGGAEDVRFKNLLAAADELVNSEREISLTAAMFIHKKAGELPPLGFTSSDGSPLVAKVTRGDALRAIFPAPRKTQSSVKSWEMAINSLDSRDFSSMTFEGTMARAMFSNESLCQNPVYRTYLAVLRREQIPHDTGIRRERLDAGFDGTLDDFKGQLSLRTMEELQSVATQAHCEVIYIHENRRDDARALVDRLRAKGLIVPEPFRANIHRAEKYKVDQVAIFAKPRGRDEIDIICGISRILAPPGQGEAIEADIEKIGSMDYPAYKEYSELRGKEIEQEKKLEQAEPVGQLVALEQTVPFVPSKREMLLELSHKRRVFREVATISTFLTYGRPEKHFEVWLLGPAWKK